MFNRKPELLKQLEQNIRRFTQQAIKDGTPYGEIIAMLDEKSRRVGNYTNELFEGLNVRKPFFNRRMAAIRASQDYQQLIDKEQARLHGIMGGWLSHGQMLEKSGDIDKAILLYERYVVNYFNGTLPYDRLRIIYTRQKNFTDAIRICEVYMSLTNLEGPAVPRSKEHFRHFRDKLTARAAKSKQ